MLFYKRNQEKKTSLTPVQIALRIVESPSDTHLIGHPEEQELYGVDEFPEVKSFLDQWRSPSTLYAGPTVCGLLSWNEIIHRIAAEPLADHFVKGRAPSWPYNIQMADWTDWRLIRDLYKAVSRHATVRKSTKHAKIMPVIQFSDVSGRRDYSMRAFARLKKNFDKSRILNQTYFLSYQNISGQLRFSFTLWGIERKREAFRQKMSKELIETGKCILPNIGVLHLKDRSKALVSFRMNARFARVLCGKERFDPQHPLTREGSDNLRYWLWTIKKEGASLSTFRKWIAWFGLSPEAFLFTRVYFSFLAYHLWSGHHACIPSFGTFRLRKYKNGRTVRFRCANTLKKEIRNHQLNVDVQIDSSDTPSDEYSFEMLYLMLQNHDEEVQFSALALLESLGDPELCTALLQKIALEKYHGFIRIIELWGKRHFSTRLWLHFWAIAQQLIPEKLPEISFLSIDNSIQQEDWKIIASMPLQGISYKNNGPLDERLHLPSIIHVELYHHLNMPKIWNTIASLRHLKIQQQLVEWFPIFGEVHSDCVVEMDFYQYRAIKNLPKPEEGLKLPINIQRLLTSCFARNQYHRKDYLDWAMSGRDEERLTARNHLLGSKNLAGVISGSGYAVDQWADIIDRVEHGLLRKPIEKIKITNIKGISLHFPPNLLNCKSLQSIEINGNVTVSFAPELVNWQSLKSLSLTSVNVEGSLLWLSSLPALTHCSLSNVLLNKIPSISELDGCSKQLRKKLLPFYIPKKPYYRQDTKPVNREQNDLLLSILTQYLSPQELGKQYNWRVEDHFKQVMLGYLSKHIPELVEKTNSLHLVHSGDLISQLPIFHKLTYLIIQYAAENPAHIIEKAAHVPHIHFKHPNTPSIDWRLFLKHHNSNGIKHPNQILAPIDEFLQFSEQERQVMVYSCKLPCDEELRKYLLADYQNSENGGILQLSLTRMLRKKEKRTNGYGYKFIEHPVVIALRHELAIESKMKISVQTTGENQREKKVELHMRDGVLPTTINTLTDVTHLSIRGNIKDFSPLFSLSNLQSLYIESSVIENAIPELFHQWTQLTQLRFRNSTIPACLINAPNLEKLDIHDSVVHTLNLSQSHLTRLMMQGTDIRGQVLLPQSLEFLSLARTTGASKHVHLEMAPKLIALWLNHGGYTIFPMAITQMVQLERLNLAHNNISKVPQELSELKELSWLNIKKTKIVLPAEIVTQLPLEFLNAEMALAPRAWPTGQCKVYGVDLSTVGRDMLPVPNHIQLEAPALCSRLLSSLPAKYGDEQVQDALAQLAK